jgi:glycosyltransferase involved in cell wall biosynthesis
LVTVLRLLPELDFGGVESRLTVQARLHDRRAYRLVACCLHKPGKAAEALRELGVQVDVLGVDPNPRRPAATVALVRYLRRLRPDVVHASIAEANLHGTLAASLTGVPVRIAEETGMPRHGWAARAAYGGVYRLASTIVGVTQAVCDYVREVDRAPPKRVRLIYNCASPTYFPEQRVPVARDMNGAYNVLLVGRLVPVKNQGFLIDVLQSVLAGRPNTTVRIAGDGPLRGELQSAIDSRGLKSQIQLLGARSDIADLLRSAHLFALPSLSEGCSVSLIEAMASGVPAIGSDVAGIREVMGPLAPAWTAAVSDRTAWLELLQRALGLSAEQRLQWAKECQERAYERFSPTVYVHTLQAMYDELVAPGGAGTRALTLDR